MSMQLRIPCACPSVAAAMCLLACGGFSAVSILRAALAAILCLAAAHDIETRRIENGTVLAVVGLRIYELALIAVFHPEHLASALAASLVGGATLLAVLLATAWLLERTSGHAGIGGGDVKLLAALGFFLGWEAGLAIVAVSCVLLVLDSALRFRCAAASAFAFAPYIAVSTLLALLAL